MQVVGGMGRRRKAYSRPRTEEELDLVSKALLAAARANGPMRVHVALKIAKGYSLHWLYQTAPRLYQMTGVQILVNPPVISSPDDSGKHHQTPSEPPGRIDKDKALKRW